MPSLIERAMESTSSQQALPRVKYRPNQLVDSDTDTSTAYKGPSLDSPILGKITTPGSSVTSTELCSSAVDVFNIKDAMYSYAALCRDGTATSEVLKQHVEEWIEHALAQNWKSRSGESFFEDFAACVRCKSFLLSPVTISCGHTYCKMCLYKFSPKMCVKCGHARDLSNWDDFKTNVVIADLIGKWWPNELMAARLKQTGNKLFHDNQIDKAIESYTQAYRIASKKDYLLTSNLSHAHLQVGQAIEALHNAETTIGLRPDWPKGYCRKAYALISLGRFEDAAIAFLQCLVLEPQLPSIVMELTKVLHRIICKSCGINMPFLAPEKHEGSKRASLVSVSAYAAHLLRRRLCFGSRDGAPDKSSDIEDISANTTSGKRKRTSSSLASLEGFARLGLFLDRCQISISALEKIEMKKINRTIDADLLDKSDFECTLCLRTLWQPITTPCGHVFCRTCIDRCLDHTTSCPLCKSSLEDYLAERRQFVTEFIEVAMQTYIPEAYAERKQIHIEEMNDLTKNSEDGSLELPVFVCTMSFPTMPCPLHIFEPKYRLMIRRCLESGTRLFGMCVPQEGSYEMFSDYGTTLEIRDVQYFPDGRAVVDAVGRKRFRVLERSMKDGYHTATVEFLKDQPSDENETMHLHEDVRSKVLQWFRELNPGIKNRILEHFGPIPDTETDYLQLENGPAWVWWTVAILPLDTRAQLAVLSMTSLRKRLEALHRTLAHLLTKPS